MKRFTIFAAIAAFALATAKAPAEPLPVSAFAYKPVMFANNAIMRDAGDGTLRGVITYKVGNRTQTAEIIEPSTNVDAAATARPGVLFVHWLGDAATTNHTEFEADAVALAKRGAVCVLLDAMWSTAIAANGNDWYEKARTTSTDYANSIQQVVDLRRAIDLLLSEYADPKRIAYVGHDFGSMYGAVLAGVDTRPSYYVLMAGNPSFSNWYLLGKKPVDVPAFIKQMEPLDPEPYLARSAAKGFLFQFATHDDYVTNAEAMSYAAAAPLPHGIFLYNTDHALKVPDAAADRVAWLETRLFP